MKNAIKLFLLCTIGVTIGYLIYVDSGVIRIDYYKTSIKTSVWVGLVILAVLFFILHSMLNIIKLTTRLNKRFTRYKKIKFLKKQKYLLEKGMTFLALGKWSTAEKFFSDGVSLKSNEPANYYGLYAAIKAQGHDYSKSQIRKLTNLPNASTLPVQLLEAKLMLHTEDFEAAQRVLENCLKKNPKNSHALSLLHTSLRKQGKWDDLTQYLPRLRNFQAISTKEIEKIVINTTTRKLNLEKAHPKRLQQAWSELPRSTKNIPDIIANYCQLLNLAGKNQKSLDILVKKLKKQWGKTLLDCYSASAPKGDLQPLLIAEKWLAKYPQDTNLLTCLGKLSIKNNMLAKGEQYFKSALKISPSQELHIRLAEVSQLNNNPLEAINHYKVSAQNN